MSSSSYSPGPASHHADRHSCGGVGSQTPRRGGHRPRRTAARAAPHAALLAVGTAVALVLGSCAADDDETTTGDTPAHSGAHTVAPEADGADTSGSGADARSPGDDSSGPRYARYVALGDSFAAFGPVDAPTSGPERCLRSSLNYPAVLSETESIGELVDVTCGGARTTDMTARQIDETPPQFDALTGDTDLVTLSIGGNDIGFGDIAGCVITTPADTGAPCRDRLEMPVTTALGALPATLDAVYAGIRQRSPDARIITTAYMPLVPAHGGCGFVSAMSPGDVTWTRAVTDRINLIVADAADRAGADLVVPDDADERHACAPAAQRYTDFTGSETGSHPMHPTATGQAAMAGAVAERL